MGIITVADQARVWLYDLVMSIPQHDSDGGPFANGFNLHVLPLSLSELIVQA